MTTTEVGVESACLELLKEGRLTRKYFDRSPDAFINSRRDSRVVGGVVLDYWWMQRDEFELGSDGTTVALHYRAGENGGLQSNGGLYLVQGRFIVPRKGLQSGSIASRQLVNGLGPLRRQSGDNPVLAMQRAVLLTEVKIDKPRCDEAIVNMPSSEEGYTDYESTNVRGGFTLLPLVMANDSQNKTLLTPRAVLATSCAEAGIEDLMQLSELAIQPN